MVSGSSMKYFTIHFAYHYFICCQVHDLGLGSSILAVPSSHPAARSRFIYSRGKLHQLPSGVISIIKKQSLFSKPLLSTILREPFVKGKQDDSDESVYEFFKRRMNKEVCMYVIKKYKQTNLVLHTSYYMFIKKSKLQDKFVKKRLQGFLNDHSLRLT